MCLEHSKYCTDSTLALFLPTAVPMRLGTAFCEVLCSFCLHFWSLGASISASGVHFFCSFFLYTFLMIFGWPAEAPGGRALYRDEGPRHAFSDISQKNTAFA